MTNLPEKQPAPAGSLPVAQSGELPGFKLPVASATCATGSLIAPTLAELNALWPEGIKGFAPREEWQALCRWLNQSPMQPPLN